MVVVVAVVVVGRLLPGTAVAVVVEPPGTVVVELEEGPLGTVAGEEGPLGTVAGEEGARLGTVVEVELLGIVAEEEPLETVLAVGLVLGTGLEPVAGAPDLGIVVVAVGTVPAGEVEGGLPGTGPGEPRAVGTVEG